VHSTHFARKYGHLRANLTIRIPVTDSTQEFGPTFMHGLSSSPVAGRARAVQSVIKYCCRAGEALRALSVLAGGSQCYSAHASWRRVVTAFEWIEQYGLPWNSRVAG